MKVKINYFVLPIYHSALKSTVITVNMSLKMSSKMVLNNENLTNYLQLQKGNIIPLNTEYF